MIRNNRVTQVLAGVLGLIGLYLSGIAFITVYGALKSSAFMLFIITMPILIVGILMLVYSYRAIYKPSEHNTKSIGSIYAAITLLYAGNVIEGMIPKSDIIVNARIVASGSTIILAILVYYGIRFLLTLESSKAESPVELP